MLVKADDRERDQEAYPLIKLHQLVREANLQ